MATAHDAIIVLGVIALQAVYTVCKINLRLFDQFR
jgi:hypothetical protein